MTAALQLSGVGRSYGAIKAVADVSLDVAAGSRHAVIGPNGAGKSTLFGLISGRLRMTTGRIDAHGQDISRLDVAARARLGVQQTFQHSSLFAPLAARDNVALAAQRRLGLQGGFWRPANRYREVRDVVDDCLERCGLPDRADVLVQALSHGERRQLEVAVALACEPRVLLLDEPTAGMSPSETARFLDLIQSLPTSVTVLIVEHDLDLVFNLATVVTVMHLGRHLATGTPEEISRSDEVQAAYLAGVESGDIFTG